MSSLYLVRHGQASFGADDYDVLSPLGAEQALGLGRYLAERKVRIDAIYSGPRRRQIETAQHLAAAAAEAGLALPDLVAIEELDEFPGIEMVRLWLPRLATEDPALAAALAASDPGAQGRAIEAAFHRVTQAWARGELDMGELESFAAFAERTTRGLRTIMSAEGRGRRVLVVTSGGPISIAMRLCLGLAEEMTLRLAMVIANASTTELRWRDQELTLFSFNHVHYLPPEHVTFR